MTDQPPSEHFKTEMPQIPGGTGPGARVGGTNPAIKLVIGLLAVLLVVFVGARWALLPRHVQPKTAGEQRELEIPSPAPDPNTLLPHATDANPGIGNVSEMVKPWTSKDFYIKNGLTGENIPAMLIRLPIGSASQATGYWAFSVNAPYGNCKLEYITDLTRLKSDYEFNQGRHPMVGNPCSRTLFDPLKTTNLPGSGVWVRGAIVQGSDLRPPLGVEIAVKDKKILAVRAE